MQGEVGPPLLPDVVVYYLDGWGSPGVQTNECTFLLHRCSHIWSFFWIQAMHHIVTHWVSNSGLREQQSLTRSPRNVGICL